MAEQSAIFFQQPGRPTSRVCFLQKRDKFDELAITNYNVRHVENETKVQGALSRLLQGKPVLVIAHRMRTVEAADKIVVLDKGRVVEEGKPSELKEKEGSVFKHMSELQQAGAGWTV